MYEQAQLYVPTRVHVEDTKAVEKMYTNPTLSV